MPSPPVPADDLYARLEVPADATFEAIEIAWRALLKRHHPDVAGAGALELAKRINVAHDWLSDPGLRSRYDRDRRVRRSPRREDWSPRGAEGEAPRPRRRPADPATALRRFLDRVGRLTADELDRLSLAETTSIAFVASIHRFLAPASVAALETVEAQVRTRLRPADWANPPTRDAVLAAAHELVLGAFLDEHLAEPFRGRARDRLMRGWEAAVDQPRYGPNSAAVKRVVERASRLTVAESRALLRAAGRQRLGQDPWPRGLDPEEDDALRVSAALAGRDVAAAAGLDGLEASAAQRARRLLRRTGHAVALRHGFPAAEFAALLAPWRAATGDPATGRASVRSNPSVRRA